VTQSLKPLSRQAINWLARQVLSTDSCLDS